MLFSKLFKKKETIEQSQQEVEKIEQIKQMMHPNAMTSINKEATNNPMNNTMSYKPLNNNFNNLKK